jgi:hypothetical protein
VRLPSEEPPRDNHPHYLVGAFENLVHAQVAHNLLNSKIGEVPVAAMELKRLVCYFEAGISRKALGHGAEQRRVRNIRVE